MLHLTWIREPYPLHSCLGYQICWVRLLKKYQSAALVSKFPAALVKRMVLLWSTNYFNLNADELEPPQSDIFLFACRQKQSSSRAACPASSGWCGSWITHHNWQHVSITVISKWWVLKYFCRLDWKLHRMWCIRWDWRPSRDSKSMAVVLKY